MRSKLDFFLFVFIFALFVFHPLLCQKPDNAKSYVIVDISVEGNKYSDPETIISLSGLTRGASIVIPGDTKIQTAIKNLWQRKQFSDVDIVIDKITTFGVFLTIKVKEFKRLSRLTIGGNKEKNEDEIRKAIGKMRGDIMSPYDQYIAQKSVKKLYENDGIMFAKVEPHINETDTAGYINMYLQITEGVEFHTESVNFIGNKAYSNSDLAGAFDKTHTKAWWQFWRSSKFSTKEYEDDKKLLQGFFKKNGYIDGEIVSDTLVYDPLTEKVKIYVKVNEGNKYYVRNIKFIGNTVYPSELLMNRLEFKKGDVYNVERLQQNLMQNEYQTDVISLYYDNGYLHANTDIEENRIGQDSIDLVIKIVERDRVTIRYVEVSGNTTTKDKVVRRELFTRPGDYFSRSAIIRSIRSLGVLNFFTPETLQKPPNIKPVANDNTKVDIEYKVEERSTNTFNASIGYAGSYGMTGSIGFTFNNFSIMEPLTGGAGQIFNFNWEFGQWNNNFAIGLTEPWLFDSPTTVGFNLFDSRYNLYYNMRRRGVSVNIGRRFQWPDDYFRGDWSISVQENDIGTQSTYWYRPGKNTEISVSQTISRLSLNNLFFPTQGSRFTFRSTFAMGALGLGSTDYFKNSLKYEVVSPLMTIAGTERLALYMSSEIGYLAGFKSDTSPSPIELYFMGGNGLGMYGVTPMRGYEDRVIGPDDGKTSPSPIGGRVMSRYVAELRFAVSLEQMPIYVYAFAEAGNVWGSLKATDPFNLKRAAGVGIQLQMPPIGIIGFSYGYGFDNYIGASSPSGWKFLFHLGGQ